MTCHVYMCPSFFFTQRVGTELNLPLKRKNESIIAEYTASSFLPWHRLKSQTCSYLMKHLGESFYDFVPINTIISQDIETVQRIFNIVC